MTCSSPPTRARSSPPALPYHTWDPRPVAGSAGLTPGHLASGAWRPGAAPNCRPASRNSRAGRCAPRTTTSGWRCASLGEAATRARRSTDPDELRDYILGPDFELGAFKGQPLTFRDWDGQLRQPILLAADNVVVSVSPQDEFVHQFSPLDTLGTDRPETECALD